MIKSVPKSLAAKIMSDKDAIADMSDGATIALGCFGLHGHLFALLEELYASGRKDLAIIAGTAAGLDYGGTDPLARYGGICKRITTRIGENKTFTDAFKAGRVEVEFCPLSSLIFRLSAAGSGVPA